MAYYISDNERKKRLLELFQKVNNIDLKTQQRQGIVDDFIGYALNRLDMNNNPPEINVDFDSDEARKNKSFANYNPNTTKINVYGNNRNLADILRSLAHEIVHHKQNTNGYLDQNSGETGSDQENEANAMAGVLLREYGKINPRIFE